MTIPLSKKRDLWVFGKGGEFRKMEFGDSIILEVLPEETSPSILNIYHGHPLK